MGINDSFVARERRVEYGCFWSEENDDFDWGECGKVCGSAVVGYEHGG